MTHDQDRVKQLQRRLSNWEPDEKCKYSYHQPFKQREYDKQGRLIQLHLCALPLTLVPSEVWQLSALQQLHLSNNHLSSLPAEIGQLSSLQELSLYDNPVQIPPPEIIAQGTPAILAYLRTLLSFTAMPMRTKACVIT